MSRQRVLQAFTAPAQQTKGAVYGSDAALDFRGPWFNTETARAYLDSPSREAFRKWAHRHDVPFIARGRRLLVAKADLDRAIGVSHGRDSRASRFRSESQESCSR